MVRPFPFLTKSKLIKNFIKKACLPPKTFTSTSFEQRLCSAPNCQDGDYAALAATALTTATVPTTAFSATRALAALTAAPLSTATLPAALATAEPAALTATALSMRTPRLTTT